MQSGVSGSSRRFWLKFNIQRIKYCDLLVKWQYSYTENYSIYGFQKFARFANETQGDDNVICAPLPREVEVLLGIFSSRRDVHVPPDSLNPDPISDRNMPFSMHIRFQTWAQLLETWLALTRVKHHDNP